MKKKKIVLLTLFSAVLLMTSCKKNKTTELALNIDGLENLGTDYVYEGWMIVDGAPITTGIFSVSDAGVMSASNFTVNKLELESASAFVLTIEPSSDPDPAPSKVHIIGGDFSEANASLSVSHSSALGVSLTAATGTYILATPTDGTMNNENSGVWWLDPNAGPGEGLSLPVLPTGWVYEGWAVIDGVPVTTGTFTATDLADLDAPYSGSMAGPAFPGEDFLNNAPNGVTFPTDLSGKKVVISIEPQPDNSSNPFLLKPLVGDVPANAVDHTAYTMMNNAVMSSPTGTATR